MVVSVCFSLPRERAVAPVRTWLQLVPVSQHQTDAQFSRWSETSLATCFSHLLVLMQPCRPLCHLVFFRKAFCLHAFEVYSKQHPRSTRLGLQKNSNCGQSKTMFGSGPFDRTLGVGGPSRFSRFEELSFHPFGLPAIV